MKKMLNEGNQIHNFISSSGSDFLTSYGSGSDSTCQKVTVRFLRFWFHNAGVRIEILTCWMTPHGPAGACKGVSLFIGPRHPRHFTPSSVLAS
jgi:hypothetical protein